MDAVGDDPVLRHVESELAALTSGSVSERHARLAIERLALLLAIAVLVKQAPAEVANSFIARRLNAPSQTFGASDVSIDEDALIARAALSR